MSPKYPEYNCVDHPYHIDEHEEAYYQYLKKKRQNRTVDWSKYHFKLDDFLPSDEEIKKYKRLHGR